MSSIADQPHLMIGVLRHINDKEKVQLTSQLPQPGVVWNIDEDLTTSHLEYVDKIKRDLSRHLPQTNRLIPWQQQSQEEERNRDWHLHVWLALQPQGLDKAVLIWKMGVKRKGVKFLQSRISKNTYFEKGRVKGVFASTVFGGRDFCLPCSRDTLEGCSSWCGKLQGSIKKRLQHEAFCPPCHRRPAIFD